MKQRIKIVLIGAGSKEFSKNLIHDLILEKDLQDNFDLKVVLVDINKKLLNERIGYARQCVKLKNSNIKFTATTERKEALPDANFVFLSVAVHRMELWEQDFRVPIAFGIKHIYGENGGPGALFHTLRNYHLIFPILRDIERLCPKTLLINFTNPEARILTAILKLTRINAIGLCHGYASFQKMVAKILKYSLSDLDIRTAGMNHFYTFYKIVEKKTGRDLRPELKKKIMKSLKEFPPLVRFLWETFDVMGYISDYHVGEYLSFASEFTGIKWKFGIESSKISPDVSITPSMIFNAWREGKNVDRYLKDNYLLCKKNSKEQNILLTKSDELAVPVIADILLNRKTLRPAVNVLNTEGYIENLSKDGCIEIPATIDAEGMEKSSRIHIPVENSFHIGVESDFHIPMENKIHTPTENKIPIVLDSFNLLPL